MAAIRLAVDLVFPVDLVTQTVAIIAKRRAGKSYAMRRLAEQLHGARQQVVIVDPKGDQWGIRSAANGRGPGLPFVILGGERGDVPLEEGAGALVAKLLVEERVSAVLDLSLFRKNQVARFMAEFLEHVYRLKAHEQYRTAMMLVIDEADAIAPQKPFKGEERMLGAAEDIVRRGGQRGLGCVLVTQRSAVLNKNVLTQAEVLIALRTIAPQDLLALKAWIDVHGTEDEGAEMMDSLPSLPVGDAWVWSPGWPTARGIFQRVHVLPIETFDSGATPKPGEKREEPKSVADVDLEAFKVQMAAVVARAALDNPSALRHEIARLMREHEKRLRELQKAPERVVETIVRPVLTDADFARFQGEVERFRQYGQMLAEVTSEISRIAKDVMAALTQAYARPSAPPAARAALPRPDPKITIPAPRPSNGSADPSIGRSGLYRMLVALAQRPQGLTRGQLGVRARVSAKGGSFDTYLSKARVNGWVDTSGERIRITEAGLQALGPYEPLPEGAALLQHYLGQFGTSGAARMLQALADAYPQSLTREALGQASNISPDGGSFDTYVSKLRTLELITGRGEIRLSEELAE